MAKLVRVRNFVNWRRFTYCSSAVKTENSSCHSGALEGLRNHFILSLPGVVGDVDGDLAGAGWSHHVNLGRDRLMAEAERIDWLFAARGRDRFWRYIGQRLA